MFSSSNSLRPSSSLFIRSTLVSLVSCVVSIIGADRHSVCAGESNSPSRPYFTILQIDIVVALLLSEIGSHYRCQCVVEILLSRTWRRGRDWLAQLVSNFPFGHADCYIIESAGSNATCESDGDEKCSNCFHVGTFCGELCT